jgi:large subunit ribosomal protein L18
MANTKKTRRSQRIRRHRRIRKTVRGSAERPRLAVFRSLRNIEGQIIDDEEGVTLFGFSTLAKEMRDFKPDSQNGRTEMAHAAGKLLAERAVKKGIESVVFDRGGYRYHGRVKAFAEGAREGGLKF